MRKVARPPAAPLIPFRCLELCLDLVGSAELRIADWVGEPRRGRWAGEPRRCSPKVQNLREAPSGESQRDSITIDQRCEARATLGPSSPPRLTLKGLRHDDWAFSLYLVGENAFQEPATGDRGHSCWRFVFVHHVWFWELGVRIAETGVCLFLVGEDGFLHPFSFGRAILPVRCIGFYREVRSFGGYFFGSLSRRYNIDMK